MGSIKPNMNQQGPELPAGCKDLSDVLKMEDQPSEERPIYIPDPVTVEDLASALGQQPSSIIADLVGLNVWATLHTFIGLESASKVAKQYGFHARRAS